MTTTDKKNKKYKSPKSTLISIRVPNFLLEDLKKACNNYPSLNMSKIIVFAVVKDIQRYLQGDFICV